MCKSGYSDKIVLNGYRKKQDTKCVGGFTPNINIDAKLIKRNCDLYLKQLNSTVLKELPSTTLATNYVQKLEKRYTSTTGFHYNNYILIISISTAAIIFLVLIIFWFLKKHKPKSDVEYTSLNYINQKAYVDSSDSDEISFAGKN